MAPSDENSSPPAPIGDLLSDVMRRVVRRSRARLEQAATAGRRRLELRQLHHDRDHFWMRLGKEAYHLVQGGEIDHPALRKAMARIDDLEARIRDFEAQHGPTPQDGGET